MMRWCHDESCSLHSFFFWMSNVSHRWYFSFCSFSLTLTAFIFFLLLIICESFHFAFFLFYLLIFRFILCQKGAVLNSSRQLKESGYVKLVSCVNESSSELVDIFAGGTFLIKIKVLKKCFASASTSVPDYSTWHLLNSTFFFPFLSLWVFLSVPSCHHLLHPALSVPPPLAASVWSPWRRWSGLWGLSWAWMTWWMDAEGERERDKEITKIKFKQKVQTHFSLLAHILEADASFNGS